MLQAPKIQALQLQRLHYAALPSQKHLLLSCCYIYLGLIKTWWKSLSLSSNTLEYYRILFWFCYLLITEMCCIDFQCILIFLLHWFSLCFTVALHNTEKKIHRKMGDLICDSFIFPPIKLHLFQSISSLHHANSSSGICLSSAGR